MQRERSASAGAKQQSARTGPWAAGCWTGRSSARPRGTRSRACGLAGCCCAWRLQGTRGTSRCNQRTEGGGAGTATGRSARAGRQPERGARSARRSACSPASQRLHASRNRLLARDTPAAACGACDALSSSWSYSTLISASSWSAAALSSAMLMARPSAASTASSISATKSAILRLARAAGVSAGQAA